MKIEYVASRPDRAGRYTVRFEDGSSQRLYRQTMEDFGIYAGKELTDDQYAGLLENASAVSAKMRAVRIISASNVSKRDLQRRLVQKGEDPQQAKDAVAWLSQLDLVDDRKTAEQIVQRCIYKGYGISRAKQALYEKQIPKEYWDEVLEGYPDQTDAIRAFLESRLGKTRDERELRRATDALLRRGHSYSEIRRAMEDFYVEQEFVEDI